VHNSRRPLDRLQYVFALCDLELWPFDLILIDGRWLVIGYPCGKFGDCSFSRFGFIARTNRQTHRVAAERLTHATVWVTMNEKDYKVQAHNCCPEMSRPALYVVTRNGRSQKLQFATQYLHGNCKWHCHCEVKGQGHQTL